METREGRLSGAEQMGVRSQIEARVAGPPTLYAWLGAGATLATIGTAQVWRRPDIPWLRPVGVAVLVAAGCCIAVPFVLLQRHGGNGRRGTYMDAGNVVNSGLYAIVRHPQYLGYVLLACGFAALAQHWAVAALATLAGLCWYLQTAQEERYCLDRFGESYRRYARAVPRLNPVRGWLRWRRRRRDAVTARSAIAARD